MKNIIFAGLFGAMLSVSCSTVNNAKVAQNQRTEFLKLKGNWEITSVEYDQNYRVKPFDEDADAQCFVGSQWKLVPNNYSGSYTLLGSSDCPTVTQPIRFEVANGSEFKFKKVLSGTKAKHNVSGYSLYLISQSENTFSLQQIVNGVQIIYNFQKIKK